MTFVKALAVGTLLASTLIAGTASAKGHNQGFGAGTAGPATAGKVDDGQSNRDGMGSETTYGQTDAVIDAKDGVAGNSVDAQNRDADNHPSNK